MTVPLHQQLLHQLRHRGSIHDRQLLLRQLKGELIGHVEKKVESVRAGLLDTLVEILSSENNGKGRDDDQNGRDTTPTSQAKPSAEADTRIQALLLLLVIANGGVAFRPAICASRVIPLVVDALKPAQNAQSVVTAALKILIAITDDGSPHWQHMQNFSLSSEIQHVCKTPIINNIASVLAQASQDASMLSQVGLVSKLIQNICVKEQQRVAMLNGTVLDLLGLHLASYNLKSPFPGQPPTPLITDMGNILGAISSIIQSSRYRMLRFLGSPCVETAFVLTPPDPSESAFATGKDGKTQPRFHAATSGSRLRRERYDSSLFYSILQIVRDGPESFCCRFHPGLATIADYRKARIEAAHLTVLMAVSGLLQVDQDERFSSGLLPDLLGNVMDNLQKPGLTVEDARLTEKSLQVLTLLVSSSVTYQKAAYNARAVERVSAILKQTFEPVHYPQRSGNFKRKGEETTDLESCQISEPGLPWNIAHALRLREQALTLVAAIANTEDLYRKEFEKKGVIPLIRDSMEPMNETAMQAPWSNAKNSKRDKVSLKEFGNPAGVLVAACTAAKVLARSVNLLRTSLIDSGLAAVTFNLLKHKDDNVSKAATDVICNLNPEYSPMREAGVIEVLCERAQSSDFDSCLRSLWALKHLIHLSSNDIKTRCIEHLGTERLVDLCTVNPYNVAKEKLESPSREVDAAENPLLSTSSGTDAMPSLIATLTSRKPDFDLETHLNYFHSLELQAVRNKMIENAISAQCQALDIIRNFIMGPQAPETIAFILDKISNPTLFEIVSGKIAQHAGFDGVFVSTRDFDVRNAKDASGVAYDHVYIEPNHRSMQVLSSALMIMTHLAAGSPHQRQQLIAQTSLMKMAHELLGHKDPPIRRAVVFCLCNLTWQDDDGDLRRAAERAQDLQALGFGGALAQMAEDENVDVRERVTTARSQMDTLLGNSSNATNGRYVSGSAGSGSAIASEGVAVDAVGSAMATTRAFSRRTR